MLDVGRYDAHVSSASGAETATSISDKGMHEWLQLGVRGSFLL
jgi:hypothetical protein